MSRESKRLKKSSSWLNSGNALIQHLSEKNQFWSFPILPGSAEAQVILGGIVKRLLIAYFSGNVSAKKINPFTCQSYSQPKVARFLSHGVLLSFYKFTVEFAVKELRKSDSNWQSYAQECSGTFFDSQ